MRLFFHTRLGTWASYQIRKIPVCACAGNAGNVFPHRRFRRKPLVSEPGMHHGTCVTHVPWCMSGSLTCGGGENVLGIPGACAPAILRIWQEAHWGRDEMSARCQVTFSILFPVWKLMTFRWHFSLGIQLTIHEWFIKRLDAKTCKPIHDPMRAYIDNAHTQAHRHTDTQHTQHTHINISHEFKRCRIKFCLFWCSCVISSW